ncbi:pyridoxamine 5'-phosphate oxidase family protein [Tundrisphaera lichenicola]|uniref:pyridoxamine 5'-phosphate oxidase family protein n=1 Tax=Tundrisphaera lichenicola TaxID=2029860 RepID=UPI003EB9427F
MIESNTHDHAVKKLGQVIHDIQFAMLTTIEPDGSLRSRPMATHQDFGKNFDGVLWFFTKFDTPKVGEVQHDKHVNLSYASPEKNKYVSVSGMAILVRDPKKSEELWDPRYQAWFPKGLEDPDLILLRVDVTKAEFWDAPSSNVAYPVDLVKGVNTGTTPDPGEHEKVSL